VPHHSDPAHDGLRTISLAHDHGNGALAQRPTPAFHVTQAPRRKGVEPYAGPPAIAEQNQSPEPGCAEQRIWYTELPATYARKTPAEPTGTTGDRRHPIIRQVDAVDPTIR
jgi:hypothetical protein